ncbi:hypothetical protein GA0070616_4278 [Micromonospora nigra]|uniref:LPXTG-motif cell wall anchor domain-containing protein n=1 Tax=Micromonospora nigra TaxID=145857 RepID=A0A1C6SPG7_9ACTN|nr:hypothetical protein GA0070616_4278 [Micromonospora nigra]
MKRLWRYTLRVGAVLACLTGVEVAMVAPAHAAFATELSGLPDEFTAGDRVETVSAVVSRTDRGGCVKVRWSMVLRVENMRLDQVKVDRVEETGSFPLEIRTEGDAARLTDRQLDPGTLCPGRTVTATYRMAFAEDVVRGRVTLAAEAYDANLRLLSRQTATRSVVGVARPTTAAPPPTVEPVPTQEPVPTEDPDDPAAEEDPEPTEAAGAPAAGTAGAPVAQSGGFGLTHAAFLLGGLLLFLGVGLLLRLRQLTQPADGGAPTGAAGDRWERRDPPAGRWRSGRR